MKFTLTRTKAALVVAAAVASGIVGVSYAAIPSSNGTISACKDNKGTLKVIDAEAGQNCSGSQQLLTWNQQGPAGPQGPAGSPTPLNYVTVSADGAQFSANSPQRPVESVVRTATGQYTITFTGPGGLQLCPRWVSSSVGPRMFSAGHGGFNNFQMFVRAYDANGALTDTPFSLHFSCPS